jgi:2-hydroxy-6-oxonona-2,4-dienedioate hydrolase
MAMDTKTGFAPSGSGKLYFETAGDGPPFVMIHAGVADSRQWANEFAHFAGRFQVVRYDMRGYGQSEPVEGEFSHLGDLQAVLAHLSIVQPAVVMGCSMGGGLAMEYALAHPAAMRALIMVGSGPPGLTLDVPTPAKFADAEAAYNAGDLDRVAELETQIWFDGEGRTQEQVDPAMRRLAYDMNRLALAHEAKQLGKRLPDAATPAAERLAELSLPVLVIAGSHDTPYILAAADYMVEKLPAARKVTIKDAAHLPNLDHPDEFRGIVEAFLDELPPAAGSVTG